MGGPLLYTLSQVARKANRNFRGCCPPGAQAETRVMNTEFDTDDRPVPGKFSRNDRKLRRNHQRSLQQNVVENQRIP